MNLLSFIMLFCHLFLMGTEDLSQTTKISIQDADLLNNAFALTDVEENRIIKEVVDHRSTESLLKESSEGFTDRFNKFKLIPCRHYFNLYKKINNKYKFLGKIMYPKKYFRAKSVTIAEDGKAFSAVLSKYDTKEESYEHKLFVWRQQNDQRAYKRFMFDGVNAGTLSQDGKTVVGFLFGKKNITYWSFKDDEYKFIDDANIHDLSENSLMGINGDGTLFFILDTILPEGHRYLPIFMYVLENNNIKLIKRFELPAKIAYADLNNSGDEMAIAYTLQERFFADYHLSPKVSSSHLIVLDIKDLTKAPELLALLNINRSFDRVRLKYDGKSILLGDGNFYSIYELGPVIHKKTVPEKPQLNCQKLLADFSYLTDLEDLDDQALEDENMLQDKQDKQDKKDIQSDQKKKIEISNKLNF